MKNPIFWLLVLVSFLSSCNPNGDEPITKDSPLEALDPYSLWPVEQEYNTSAYPLNPTDTMGTYYYVDVFFEHPKVTTLTTCSLRAIVYGVVGDTTLLNNPSIIPTSRAKRGLFGNSWAYMYILVKPGVDKTMVLYADDNLAPETLDIEIYKVTRVDGKRVKTLYRNFYFKNKTRKSSFELLLPGY